MNREEFEQLRDSSLGHLLVRAGRLHGEKVFSQVNKTLGQNSFRPSHFQLMAYIPFEGITIVDLAKKAQISKQAVSAMIKYLLEVNIVIKKDNPVDKRSFLVMINQASDSPVYEGMKVAAELDTLIEELLSKKELQYFKSALNKIIGFY